MSLKYEPASEPLHISEYEARCVVLEGLLSDAVLARQVRFQAKREQLIWF